MLGAGPLLRHQFQFIQVNNRCRQKTKPNQFRHEDFYSLSITVSTRSCSLKFFVVCRFLSIHPSIYQSKIDVNLCLKSKGKYPVCIPRNFALRTGNKVRITDLMQSGKYLYVPLCLITPDPADFMLITVFRHNTHCAYLCLCMCV